MARTLGKLKRKKEKKGKEQSAKKKEKKDSVKMSNPGAGDGSASVSVTKSSMAEHEDHTLGSSACHVQPAAGEGSARGSDDSRSQVCEHEDNACQPKLINLHSEH
jgi:hypothetical protein